MLIIIEDRPVTQPAVRSFVRELSNWR